MSPGTVASKSLVNEKGASHPIVIGACAVIFRLDEFGTPFEEGRAQIIGHNEHRHCYRVRFVGERVLRNRFIDPDWQRGTAAKLKMLVEFWRANNQPSHDDFFPETE